MYERIQRLLRALATDLHEREEAIRLGLLAAAAGESLFLLGPPGTGKSLIARRLEQAFRDATAFTYLMGRFSTPDEVFGPLSIRALREEDRYERNTTSYLPDADVVFLDEIWKASPPIQNALLTALNERRYRNGTEEIRIPLKVFIGASNELPSDADEAAAFWDRFLVRLVVGPIEDAASFAGLLDETADPYREVVAPELRITDEEYDRLRTAESSVVIPPPVVELIAAIRSALAKPQDGAEPVYVSDRRWKKIAGLLRMSAVLHGRDRVEAIDCAIIRSCAWSTLAERVRVNEIVAHELSARSGRGAAAQRFASRLQELRATYRTWSARLVDDERRRPVVYRDEYFRLHPGETAAQTTTAEAKQELLLVWHGDIDEARRHGEAEIDLFVYDEGGGLVGSQRSRVRFTDEWRLEVDGEAYTVETAVERITIEEERALHGEERASLEASARELVGELDGELDALLAEQASLEDAAHEHLFVAAADTDAVLESIRATARQLSETRVLALEFSSDVLGA